MAVLIKKDEKVSNVVNELPVNFSEQDFIAKFKEIYPTDWDKIVKNYNNHVRKTKPGKSFPMPEPEQYLINAVKVWQKKGKAND